MLSEKWIWCAALALSPGLALGAAMAEAAQRGDMAAVRSWLQKAGTNHKADVNEPLADGTTALHWAVRADDLEITRLLLKAGATVNTADRYGVTPLYLACTNANSTMVNELLRGGADSNSANPAGETAVMTAARTGKIEVIKVLLDHGANLNTQEKVRGQTALMWAVAQGHAPMAQFLIDRGADVNLKTTVVPSGPQFPNQMAKFGAGAGIIKQKAPAVPSGGMTALLYAAREGNLEMTRLLLAAGADINHREAAEVTPLILAIVNGHYDLAMLLMEKGADIDASDVFGRTPLYAAIDMRNLSKFSGLDPRPNPLDPLELIKAALARGANVNARTKTHTPARGWAQIDSAWVNLSGQTPFSRAALSGDLTVMRMLLDKGADPNITSFDGTTPLMVAAGVNWVVAQSYTHSPEESLEAVKLCLSLGNDIHAVNSLGVTALHGAAHRGSDDIVQLLVEKGARLDVKDKEGRTPLSFAEGVFLADNPPVPRPATAVLIRKLMGQTSLTKDDQAREK